MSDLRVDLERRRAARRKIIEAVQSRGWPGKKDILLKHLQQRGGNDERGTEHKG